MKLHVILTTTREKRQGVAIADWLVELAKKHAKFEVTLVDLKEINLPVLDEPEHPRFRKYEHAHTKAFSALIDAADAFAWVMPEYNYAMPPAMLNALDYLSQEWAYKPSGLVSYGGVSGGTRSAQMSKLVLTSLKSMPLPEAVSLPMFSKHIENAKFVSNEGIDKSANLMLDELVRWATALKALR